MSGRHRAQGGGIRITHKRDTPAARQRRAERALARTGGDVAAAARELGEPAAYVAGIRQHIENVHQEGER